MVKSFDTTAYENALRERGLKATSRRIALLDALTRADSPISIPELVQSLGRVRMDMVTVYRALEALTETGLVRQVDLRHGHTDYEIVKGGSHHHHVVCRSCGDVEDVDWCPSDQVQKSVLAHAKRFSRVSDHAVEFFGLCNTCV